MLSSPLSTPQQSERIGFFRNPGIFFVFMRLCIYLILAEAVTYVVRPPLLYWIGRDFSQTSPRVVFLA